MTAGSVKAVNCLPDLARKTRDEHNDLAEDFDALLTRLQNRILHPSAVIDDATTDGKLKTTAATAYGIGNAAYTKAATDNLWDLTGETDTAALVYRAYWLYLDAAGAATFAAGSDLASAALAIASLPAVVATKSVIGVYVAGPETDFDGAAGLAAQGTIINGAPLIYTQTGYTVTV